MLQIFTAWFLKYKLLQLVSKKRKTEVSNMSSACIFFT